MTSPPASMPLQLGLDARLRFAVVDFWSNVTLLWLVALFVYCLAISHPIMKLCRVDERLGDFYTFRNAARALSHGQDLYAGSSNEYVYPPLIAFLYQPLARIPLHAAGVVSLVINSSLFLVTLWLLGIEMSRRFLGRTSGVSAARIAVIAAVLTCDKIRCEFNMWETNVLLLLLCTMALALADRRPSIAGAALGFAFNIKYLPITLLPYLILRRRWGIIGGFCASALIFALVPAISMGWSGNLRALSEAYSGLAGLLRFPVHHAAHLYPMTDWRSLSATSGIARMINCPDRSALVVGAMLGLVFVSVAALASERHKIAPLRWPASSRQRAPRYHAIFGVEWVVILMLTLVFSPFTNGAHLYLLLMANAAGAALLLSSRRGLNRLPLILGMAVMYLGITFPPGGGAFKAAEEYTKWIGLPAWCVLVNCGTLYWTTLQFFCTAPALPVEEYFSPTARHRSV